MMQKTLRDVMRKRTERGEGVRGDFGFGGRHGAEKSALAGVREADEANVGDRLELELEHARLARLPLGAHQRRATRGRFERLVAETARAACKKIIIINTSQ